MSAPSTSSKSRLKTETLFSGVLILMLATVLQRSIGLGRGVLFCRWLPPEMLGQWDMAYSFLLLAAPVVVLGVPGSLGRYLEHFRQRGQLHTFVLRTSGWTLLCSLLGIVTIVWWAPYFSQLVFGSDDYLPLVYGVALCLATVVLHHSVTSLLTALRLFRVATIMNFAQSLLFAAITLSLLLWKTNVAMMLFGYGAASLLSSLGALAWIWSDFRHLEQQPENVPHSDFWPRILRFALFVWVSNLLAHLFAISDRYMLLHYSGMEPELALEQVGHLHSSRMVPLLLVSFADLLSGLVLPHLSHDWERGDRDQVRRRMLLILKLTALGMLAFGTIVLLFSPLLFNVLLKGKYGGGFDVLPWTLTGCIWYSLYALSQNYLWCAEHTRRATAPLALGLLLNVLLNLLMLPIWGLYGAVLATTLSTLACLSVILLLSHLQGMLLDRGTVLLTIAPLAVAGGLAVASLTFIACLALCLTTDWLFEGREKLILRSAIEQQWGRLHVGLKRSSTPA